VVALSLIRAEILLDGVFVATAMLICLLGRSCRTTNISENSILEMNKFSDDYLIRAVSLKSEPDIAPFCIKVDATKATEHLFLVADALRNADSPCLRYVSYQTGYQKI